MNSLRIAQVSPLYESVPPKLYGGTERVVAYLTDALLAMGHDVTVFASGDSETRATLVPVCRRALRLDPDCVDPIARHTVLIEQVLQHASEFDIVHFHCDYLHFPASRRERMTHVTTLHGRLDLPDLVPLYRKFTEVPVVSISDSQREPLFFANWIATVHHGLPPERFRPQLEGGGRYLTFIGRISPEKRVDRAIEIARRTGMPLKIAAKVSVQDREYFSEHIKPLIDNQLVEYLGEVGERDKHELLCNAYALVFPIDWPEPFGMVMIEAMACGTPVIAWRCGAIPEVLEDGVSGLIVDSMDQAVRAVERAGQLSRARCREAFERRFTADRMARNYVDAYRSVIARRWDTRVRRSLPPRAAA